MTRRKIKILEIGPAIFPRIPRGKNVTKRYIEPIAACKRELKELGFKILRGKAQRIPLKENSQDIIEMHNVLSAPRGVRGEFQGDKKKALEEARRVLRKGGRLILTNTFPKDENRFKQIMNIAKSVGFKIVKIKSNEKIAKIELEFYPSPPSPTRFPTTRFSVCPEPTRRPSILVLEKI